jgi:hypothetical protein
MIDVRNSFKNDNTPAYLITGLFFLAGVFLLIFANGTGDEGDSVMHYLYARHAFQYPEFFLYHWAKPVFTLIAAPFAQAGFKGLVFMNIVVSSVTIFLTYRIAQKLKVPLPWLAALATALSPLMMIVTFSGLTEPLFALWMMIGFYFLVNKKYLTGFLWISFLPFVRSEGLIILCVLVVYAFFERKWKYIPLLMVGHLAFSLAGLIMHKDPLWVFNEMSYAVLSSAYGEGYWNDFLRRLPEVSGTVLCFFLVLGLLYGAIRTVKRFFYHEKDAIGNNELFLVYGSFVTYFIAHSLFWAFGIFNSFGLIRVMMAVIPLMGIICARGVKYFSMLLDVTMKSKAIWISVALIIIFPFLPGNYGFKWKRDFSLKADQLAEKRMSNFVKKNYPDYKNYVFYYEACYNSVALDVNYFDSTEHRRLLNAFEENRFPPQSFIVWDDWYARMAGNVEYEKIEKDGRFALLGIFTEKDVWNNPRVVRLYRKKN